MRLGFAAFSAQGYALAQRLAQVLGGTATRCGVECPLRDWIREAFAQYEGLVFVGAVRPAHCGTDAQNRMHRCGF